ncbi:MAG: MFS transporter [Synergistaceae bacterium]|jgi:MFS family permease|nr:MFS transporter [Synergistaceae bacterium]
MSALIKFFRFSDNTKFLLSMFVPLYAIHCMEQIYFIYGNVLGSYGLSPQTTGNILGAFFGAIMSARPMGGWMIENLGIRRTMAASGFLALVGCSMLCFERSVPLLYAGRIISGAGFGIFSIGLFSYQAIRTTPKARGAAFAITTIGGVLPMGTMTPLGDLLVTGGHVKTYLAMGPVIAVICLLLSGLVKDEKLRETSAEKSWGAYGSLVRSKPFVMLCVTCAIMALIDASSVSISMMAAERGLVASSFIASLSAAAVITRLCGAQILNRIPHLLAIAPCAMLMSCAILAASVAKSNVSFLSCGILFGIGIGGGFPLMLASVSDILPEELRPKGTAVALLLYDLGWFVTPLLIGALTPSLGIARSFTALACAALAVSGVLTIFYWAPARTAETRMPKP